MAYCASDKNLTEDHIIHKTLLKTTQSKPVIMGQQYHSDLLQKEENKDGFVRRLTETNKGRQRPKAVQQRLAISDKSSRSEALRCCCLEV